MITSKPFFIFSIITFLITSCSTTKVVENKPDLRFAGITLSKGLDKKDVIAVPVDPATTFTTMDPEVIAFLKFENLGGEHILRWDWHDPRGNLYYSTGNYPIKTAKGKYLVMATAWHKIAIKGESAAKRLGEWEVKVYFNNIFIDSKHFILDALSDVDSSLANAKIPNPDYWGFIIGIENYANLPSVDYAKRDALRIKEYFVKILGVPHENIIYLIDSNATKSSIEGLLKSYLPKNVKKDTTLYIYFAGHGLPLKIKGTHKPYLVAHDSDIKTIAESGYRLKSFYEDVNNLKIKRAFVFLDACFSGIAARGESMLLAGMRPIVLEEREEGLFDKLFSMSASSGGQMSGSYPEMGHGLFSYYLLKGLRGEADTNRNETIDMDELYIYVKDNVVRTSRRMGMEQTPEIFSPLQSAKDIVVTEVLKEHKNNN